MIPLIAFVVGIGLCLAVNHWVRRRLGGRGRKLVVELKRFFGTNPRELPIVTRSFNTVDLPNLQLALDHYVEVNCARARVMGYASL